MRDQVDKHLELASSKVPAIRRRRSCPSNLAESPRELLTSLTESSEARFRLLKPSERVIYGDYIENGESDYRLWEGPTGFRADSFLNNVYRTIHKGNKPL